MSAIIKTNKKVSLEQKFAVILLILVLFFGLSYPQIKHPNLWPRKVIHFQKDTFEGTPVSITPLSENYYFLADYVNIYLLNDQNGELNILQTDLSPNFLYYPTGVFYSKQNQRLFVANYLANDILVFEVETETHKLLLRQEIISPNTIGPENIFVSDDGKHLASANFDGNSVTFFDLTQEIPQEVWHVSVGEAHGICILNNKVYATSLTDRKIYEIDISSGEILRSIGSPGWDPSKEQYLWPTSIYPYGENSVVISDAHTGYISVLNIKNLKTIFYFGGNGPTYRYLNMPYSINVNDENLIIVSAFQRRIIFGTKFLSFKKVISIPNDWQYSKKIGLQVTPLGPPLWDNRYIEIGGPTIGLSGEKYLLGYSLIYSKSLDSTIYQMPLMSSLFNDSIFYFLEAKELSGGYIIFSPETRNGLYLSKDRKYLIPLELPIDSWLVKDNIYSSAGQVDTSVLEKKANEKVQKIKEMQSRGIISNPELCDFFLFLPTPTETCTQRIIKSFPSEQGKEFIESYEKISTESNQNPSMEGDLKKLAQNYYSKIPKDRTINIGEISLVGMLTGQFEN